MSLATANRLVMDLWIIMSRYSVCRTTTARRSSSLSSLYQAIRLQVLEMTCRDTYVMTTALITDTVRLIPHGQAMISCLLPIIVEGLTEHAAMSCLTI